MKLTSMLKPFLVQSWFLLTISLTFPHHVRTSSCATEDQQLICKDCFTIVLCSSMTATECSDDLLCLENGNFAACANGDEVPSCYCPSSGLPTTLADPYDPQAFIVCLEDGSHRGYCTSDTIWDQETLQCVPMVTTSTTTTSTPTSDCTYQISQVDCTHYQITFRDCTITTYECEQDKVFNADTNRCENYIEFSCSNHSLMDGLYPDTQNCSIVHTCINGQELGTPFVCPEDGLYDPVTESCVSDPNLVDCPNPCSPEDPLIPSYVECNDGTEFYPVDCHTYYGCIETSPGSGFYEPTLESCSDGLVVNFQLRICDIPQHVPYCQNL